MTIQAVIVVILIGLAAVASLALALDARQRRIDRHVARAISTADAEIALNLRRKTSESRERSFHRLLGYQPELPYIIAPRYVGLAGAIAAVAVIYANSLVGFAVAYAFAAALLVALFAVRGLFGWQRRRLSSRLFRQLPDAIEIMISTVRSGLPVVEAFRVIAREMAEPTSGQFAIVCSEAGLGRPLEEALEAIYDRTGVAEYGFLSVTLGVQAKSGGNLAETLRALAETVRQRVTLAARAKALAGEVIFSSRALSASPVVVGGVLYAINPQLVDLLLSDPVGKLLLTYAVLSVIVGTLVIRWMVRRETQI